MKKLLTLALAFAALAGIVSCGSDDETTPKFLIDDTNLAELNLNAYYAENNFLCCFREDGEIIIPQDEFRFDFEITDGEYSIDAEGNATDFSSGELGLSVSINSYNDGTEFVPGEFTIWDSYGCSSNENDGIRFYAYWSDRDFDYVGFSGTANITKDGDKFTFDFDGLMLDYNSSNQPARGEGFGCPAPYLQVPVSGKFSATFTKINSLDR